MDNLTHTLIGATIAETAYFALPKGKSAKANEIRRPLLHWASFLGNNFPDLDFLYVKITPGPLGYLLHHRGHTHTLIALLPQLVFLLLVLFGFRKLLKRKPPTFQDIWSAALLIGIGLFAHIFADGWNSYGVHPFYPWNSKWYYGDAVFIIEPLIWSLLGMSLLWQFRSSIARILFPLLLVTLTFLLFLLGGLGAASLIFFLASLLVTAWGYRALPTQYRAPIALMLTLGFVGILKATSLHARNEVTRAIIEAPRNANTRIHDIVMNPAPAQPFCWSFVTVETDMTRRKYVTRQGYLSLAPQMINASSCPQAKWHAPHPQLEGNLIVVAKHETELEELSGTDRANCNVSAWLRFARTPVIDRDSAFDLRFSAIQRANFSKLEFAKLKDSCPPFIPPWEKPRQDVLSESAIILARKAKSP